MNNSSNVPCILGLMLACKKGTLREDRKTRTDVDKEVFLLQSVFDENKSWHLDENLKINGIDPAGINKEDESFVESNLMHAINGRFFGNLEGLDVCYGTKVAWYLGALGNEVDMHTGEQILFINEKHYYLQTVTCYCKNPSCLGSTNRLPAGYASRNDFVRRCYIMTMTSKLCILLFHIPNICFFLYCSLDLSDILLHLLSCHVFLLIISFILL